MTTIVREIWIDAPRQEVWEKAMVDFGNISIWNPNVPSSYSTNNIKEGLGAERHCDLTLAGASVEERVTKWDDGRMMEVLITDGQKTPPWKNPKALIELFDERGGTRMRMTFSYGMKLGPIGWLMDIMMVKPQFGKAIEALPAGLKHYMETGQKGTAKEIDFSQVVAVAA
ncbi:MAG: SRPBCC family protein [Chloroflexota bacterium]